jgi:hypothetical protein
MGFSGFCGQIREATRIIMIGYNTGILSYKTPAVLQAPRGTSKPLGRSAMSDHTPELPLKRCSKGDNCIHPQGPWLPATNEYFYKDRKGGRGLGSTCKPCSVVRASQWAKANPDKRKRNLARYAENNREAVRTRGREWARAHSEQRKEYYWRNITSFRIRRKAQYDRDRDQNKVASRRYYYAKWESNKTKARERYYANREVIIRRHANKQYNARRQARKRNLPVAYTKSDWDRALAYFGGICAVCGRPPGLWHTIAADHWIPLSSPDCPGTIPTNIVPLCHGIDGCNNSKHSRLPIDWLIDRFGKREAKRIAKRIDTYFKLLEDADAVS